MVKKRGGDALCLTHTQDLHTDRGQRICENTLLVLGEGIFEREIEMKVNDKVCRIKPDKRGPDKLGTVLRFSDEHWGRKKLNGWVFVEWKPKPSCKPVKTWIAVEKLRVLEEEPK